MTTNTANQSDWDVELPEPLEQLDDEIGQEEDRLSRLRKLGDEIEMVYSEANQLDQEGREIVAEEIPKVRHDLGGSRTIGELEEITGRIVDIVADPYRQAVRQVRDDVCDALGLASELDEATLEELDGLLEDRSSDQLREDRDAFDAAETRLDKTANKSKDVIADKVREDPVRILGSPGDEFQPLVNQHAEQYDALEKLDDELDDVAWCPDITLVQIESLYSDDGTKVDVEAVAEYVGNIGSIVETMPDALPLEPVIRCQLEAVIPKADPEALSQTFETISEQITDCADHRTEFELAIRLVDGVEDQTGHTEDVDYCLDKVRAPLDDDGLLGSEDPVDGLVTHLGDLSEEYTQWAEHYRRVLKRDSVAIDAIQSHIDVPEFQPDEGSLTVAGDSPSVDEISGNPLEAVRAHDAYREWVEALRSEGTGKDPDDGQANVDLLIDLVRGKKVSSKEVDPDNFEVLASLLEDGLRLQYDGAHVPEEQ